MNVPSASVSISILANPRSAQSTESPGRPFAGWEAAMEGGRR